MKKILLIVIILSILLILAFVGFNWHNEIFIYLKCEWKEILNSTIGGAIGGLIVLFFVIHIENKRENRSNYREDIKSIIEKKEKCTKALLNTQMAIILQMTQVPGLGKIMHDILNFDLLGKTLEHHFKDVPTIGEKAEILKKIIQEGSCSISNLIELTYYTPVLSPTNNDIVALPYEIFDIPNILPENEILVGNIACYFQDIAFCNKEYATIISSVMRNNEIRDSMIINQSTFKKETITSSDIERFVSVMAGKFDLALKLNEKIPKYLEKSYELLIKTKDYIEALGISEPIHHVEKDENIYNLFKEI